jgi:FSR family fosmidomycin resistance protein-like MFS transporter
MENAARNDYKIIGLIGLGHGTSHFFHLILPPLFPWVKIEFGLSNAELGLLMTAFFVVSGLGQILAGFIVDRFGAVSSIIAGLGLSGIASIGFSLSDTYGSLLAFAAIAGLGNSVFHPADYSLLNKKVNPARLGHAYSIHGISGALGWAAAPIFLVGFATLFDWRTAVAMSAIVAFVVLATLFINLRSEEISDLSKFKSDNQKVQHGLAFLKLKCIWMCFGFFLISALAFGGIQSFAPLAIGEVYAVPHALAIGGVTAYMISSAVGLFFGGFLASGKYPHDKIIGVSLSIAGLTAIFLSFGFLGGWSVIPLMAVIGIGAGLVGPSRDLLVRSATPKGATGRVYGVVYSGLDVGIALAPPIFGLVMDLHHPAWILVMIGAFQITAIAAAIGVRQQGVVNVATSS